MIVHDLMVLVANTLNLAVSRGCDALTFRRSVCNLLAPLTLDSSLLLDHSLMLLTICIVGANTLVDRRSNWLLRSRLRCSRASLL